MATNKFKSKYALIEAAYTGENIENYLWEFPREIDYASRLQNSFYLNLFQSIIDSMVVPVFGEEPSRMYSNPVIEKFIEDCDARGTSLTEFMYGVMTEWQKTEQAFIVMDNFSEVPERLNDALAGRKIPYLQLKKAYEVRAINSDKFDAITSIEFDDGFEEITMLDGRKEQKPVYILIDSMNVERGWYGLKGSKNVLSTAPHGLGIVPVISVNTELLVYPPAFDAASTNIAIFNQHSEQRDLERSQGFSILEIPMDQPKDDVTLGSKNIIFVPTDSSRGSAYISPNPAILSGLIDSSDKNIQHLIGQADVLGTNASAVTSSSGVALGYKFLGKNFSLSLNSKKADSVDASIINLLSAFFPGATLDWEYVVSYNKEFLPTDGEVISKIDVLERMVKMNLSDEVSVELKKEILKQGAKLLEIDEAVLMVLLDSIKMEVPVVATTDDSADAGDTDTDLEREQNIEQ